MSKQRAYQKGKVVTPFESFMRMMKGWMPQPSKVYKNKLVKLNFLQKKLWQSKHPEIMEKPSKTVGVTRQQRRYEKRMQLKPWLKEMKKKIMKSHRYGECIGMKDYKRYRADMLRV